MSNINLEEERAKLKQVGVTALKCMSVISSELAVIHPIFGVAGSLIRLVLHQVDDEEIQNLKSEFASVNSKLKELSEQNKNTLQNIMMGITECQYLQLEQNLHNQYCAFLEMVNARPEHIESKKEDFKRIYAQDMDDQNLHTLYDSVVGTGKAFSEPILKVYLEHSKGNYRIMEVLIIRLNQLFCIGLTSFMGHRTILMEGRDQKEIWKYEESLIKEWKEKMDNVQKCMQNALMKCSK